MAQRIIPKKDLDKAIEFIMLAFQLHSPKITRKQVENIIINIGNQIQIDRIIK